MSVAYDIGFNSVPDPAELDEFLQELRFQKRDQQPVHHTAMYESVGSDHPDEREIEFWYKGAIDLENSRELMAAVCKNKPPIAAYGQLKTYTSLVEPLAPEERERLIREHDVRRQIDYYRHLDRDRLRFFETALALRERFGALVASEQTGGEINPDEVLYEGKDLPEHAS